MVDKKNNADHDEYQFPADEYVASAEGQMKSPELEFHEEEPAKAASHSAGILPNFPLLKNKRIVVVVSVAIIALIAYKIMQPAPVKVVAAAPQTIVKQEVSPRMSGELSDLQQALQNNQASVNQLQTQIQSVNSTLGQTAQSEASNQAAINALTKQVSLLTEQVKELQAVGAKVPVAKFHVKAIVDGRAWLVNSNGLEKTVRVGDVVPHYGEVTAINSATGEVTTNSGRIIHLGNNDA